MIETVTHETRVAMTLDSEATLIDVRLLGSAIEVAAWTHVGRVRAHNEDALLVDLDLKLVAVADGMGGHALGEVASREALMSLAEYLCRHVRCFAEDTVTEALIQANRRIYETNCRRGYRSGAGMGSTVAGLWFGRERAIRFHVGDSRVYRYRQDRLEQLTRDHSLYQAWLDAGGVGVAPASNVITRSLGCFAEVEPEVAMIDYRKGDRFLVCSDGLTRYWTPPRLAHFFAQGEIDLQDQVRTLVETANAQDGSDNITALLIRVGE